MMYNYTENGLEGNLTFIFLEDFRAPVSINKSHPAWGRLIDLKNSGQLDITDEETILSILSPNNGATYTDWMDIVGVKLESNLYGTFLEGVQVSPKVSNGLVNLLGEDTSDMSRLSAVSVFLKNTEKVPEAIKFSATGELRVRDDGSIIFFRSVKKAPKDMFTIEDAYIGSNDIESYIDGVKYPEKTPLYPGGVVTSTHDRGMPLVMKETASRAKGTQIMAVVVRPEDIISVHGNTLMRVSKYTIIGFGDTAEDSLKTPEVPIGDLDVPGLIRLALDRIKVSV